MKGIYLLVAFIVSVVSYGQKMPSDYFQEGDSYFEVGKFEKALNSYQYIVEHYPKSELYPRAFYNIGYIHYFQKDYKKAIVVFEVIIESDFNETENLGGSIMADPYTNYRHRACSILSEIFYNKNKFDKALHYLALSDTAYPYLHFCGNEYASNAVQTALRYADIYQKLNQPDKAIEKLLPCIFDRLANNSEIIEELKKLLKGKEGLKKDLDNSLDKIYSKKIYRDDYSFSRYYFMFLNTEILVPPNYKDDSKDLKIDEMILEIKQSDFYKMIEQL